VKPPYPRDLAYGFGGAGEKPHGGLLMGALMKPGQRVGLKFEGNGPLKKIIVEQTARGRAWFCRGP